MKRLTALFFAVLRAGLSYAIFAIFGALCAFCALAFEFGNISRNPGYSDALSDFLSDDSASEISLSDKELTEGFLGLLIDLEQKKKSAQDCVGHSKSSDVLFVGRCVDCGR